MIGGARYFGPRYFAPTYWPKLGDVLITAITTRVRGFMVAVSRAVGVLIETSNATNVIIKD